MAGGTWTEQNKVRPGVYIRFATGSDNVLTLGDRGVVAICEPLSWGPQAQIMEITADTDVLELTGYEMSHANNRFLREIFKGSTRNGDLQTTAAQKVLLYRPAATGQAQATASVGNLTATAKYYGARGNNLSIIVRANADGTTYTVITLLSGVIVDEQSAVTTAQTVQSNAWITFGGTGSLTATTGTALAGGANGTVAAAAYSSFLTAIEGRKFDVVCYDGSDADVLDAFALFVNRIAAENGQYAQAVVAGYAANSRFVINVGTGVVLDDGTTLTAAQATWWVAGVEAGARYNQSLTYAEYPGAVAIKPSDVKTDSQIITAINDGVLVLTGENGRVHIETDINSLKTYSLEIGKVYRKNRVMRLCSQIANAIKEQYSANFIGLVDNNEIGRERFKSVIVGLLLDVQANNGIQNFTESDVTVSAGTEADAVVVNVAIQSVDAVEKIYMTVVVS